MELVTAPFSLIVSPALRNTTNRETAACPAILLVSLAMELTAPPVSLVKVPNICQSTVVNPVFPVV